MISLLRDPRLPLESLVSHRIPFGRAPEAYPMLDEDPDDAVQVVFDYEGG